MKVAHFIRKPRQFGNFSIETYFRLIREQLVSKIDIRVYESKYTSNGIFNRIYNCFEAAGRQLDVNHILGDVTFLSFLLKKKKTLITFLDCSILRRTSGLKHLFIKWIWFTIPVRRCIYITAISEATKQDLIRFTGCQPEKIEVVYVAISQLFKPVPAKFNTEQPVILQIGTAENKNIPRLIEALEGISCKLKIIGKVSEEIKSMLAEHKVEHELFERRLSDEEVYREYVACDILSFVSTSEGFGMPIVEANATGRVVITGNNTSMPEVAGNAACIVDPFRVEDIRSGFLKIIQDKQYREVLVQNGFRNAERFSIEQLAAQYQRIYKEIYQGEIKSSH